MTKKILLLMFLVLAIVFSSQVNAKTIAWCNKYLAEDLENTFNNIHCDVTFPFDYDLGDIDQDRTKEFGGYCDITNVCGFPVENGIYCGEGRCKFQNKEAYYWIPVSTLYEYQTGDVTPKKITKFEVYATDFNNESLYFAAYNNVTWKTPSEIDNDNNNLINNLRANLDYVTFPYIPIIETSVQYSSWQNYFNYNNKAKRVFYRSQARLSESYKHVYTNLERHLYNWSFSFSSPFEAEVFALKNIAQSFAIVMTINDSSGGDNKCSDGTTYGDCNDQGKRCNNGELVDDSSCSGGGTSQPSNCIPADYTFQNYFPDSRQLMGTIAVMWVDENNAPNGGSSLKLTKQEEGISYLVFPVNVEQGEKYVVSAWIKTRDENFARLFATHDINTIKPLPYTESIHKGDGTWKHLFYTFNASGDYVYNDHDELKHYIVVAAGSSQNRGVGDIYLYKLDIKKISRNCLDNLQTCEIESISWSDDCGVNGCRKGNNITISANYSGACSNKMFVQIDARSDDGKCYIQHTNPNMGEFISGMDFACDQSPCTAQWQFPDIPHDCYSEQMNVKKIGLWKNAVSVSDGGTYQSGYNPNNNQYPNFFIASECQQNEKKCSDDGKEIISCENGQWDYDNTRSCTENETCIESGTYAICIPTKCVDGTEPGECSTQNKGKMCVDTGNGLNLTDNFTCGCPDGYYPDYSDEECKSAENICIQEGIDFVHPDSTKKALCENTNGTYKPIYEEISIGDIKVNCTINYTCECSEGSYLLGDECISTCNHDGICDLRVENLSCDDCSTSLRLEFGTETNENGCKFIGDSHEIPQKMWVCNYTYDISLCKSACERGNKGINSPCICSSSIGECYAECYDKTGDAYIILDAPNGKTFINKITYTCPQYGVDKLQKYFDYFKGFHEDLHVTLNEFIELMDEDPNNKNYETTINKINDALLVLDPFIPYLQGVINNPTYTTTQEAHIRVNQTIERLNEILRQGLFSTYRIENVTFDKVLPMYSNADIEFEYMTMASSSRENEKLSWTYIKCNVIDPSGDVHELNTPCENITRTSIIGEKTTHKQLYLDKSGNWTIDFCELYVSMYNDCNYNISFHKKEHIGSIYATYVPLVTIKDITYPSSALVNDKINISVSIENKKQSPASMILNCTIKDPDDTNYVMTYTQQIPANSTAHVNLTKTMNKKGRWLFEGCSLYYIDGSFEHSKSVNRNIVISLPDFVLGQSLLQGSVRPGDEIGYDLTLNNTGRTTNFTFSLSSSSGWLSRFLVNYEEKNQTMLQRNEKALIKVYVKHINATHNSTIRFSARSLEGLEKTTTIRTLINTTNNPPSVNVDDLNEVNENEDITFVADINDIDGDEIVEAKVCQDPDCYNVYCDLEKNTDEYTCTYNNNLDAEREYEYYVVAKDANGAETITNMHRFYVSSQPAATCDSVSCPGTDSECYCLDGECKPCPSGSQCIENQCVSLPQTECGDGFCDIGEDCPQDCGQQLDFTMLIIIFIIILIAGGIYYYKVHGESHGSIFK